MGPQESHASWRTVAVQFWSVAGGFWRGAPGRYGQLVLAALLLTMIGSEVALLLRFNSWNRDLFDALEAHDVHGVLIQSGVLVLIVAGMCVASAGQLYGRRQLALKWRAWLVRRLTEGWFAANLHAPANVDGRIAEDARVATEEAVELVASLCHALITSSLFISLLWTLSDHPPILAGSVALSVPGYLLWLALLYSGVGMAAALLAGRPLIRATDARQAHEAEYRAALVRTREAGEPRPAVAELLGGLFQDLARIFERQTRAFVQLEVCVCAVARLGLGLPYLVGTPAYLVGAVTLGWLMQAAQAFQTVTGALGWPVAYMPRLATWRASAERVMALAAVAPAVTQPALAETSLARPATTV